MAKKSASAAPETLSVLKSQTNPKGDPLEIARIAGIMGAKKTSELIPLCHQLNLSKVNVTAEIIDDGIYLEAEAITGPARAGGSLAADTRSDARQALTSVMEKAR